MTIKHKNVVLTIEMFDDIIKSVCFTLKMYLAKQKYSVGYTNFYRSFSKLINILDIVHLCTTASKLLIEIKIFNRKLDCQRFNLFNFFLYGTKNILKTLRS